MWGGEKYTRKETELTKLETKIEHNLETHKKKVSFFEQNNNCPTCTQPIDERFKQTQIYEGKKKINELEEGLQKLFAEIENTKGKIKEMDAINQRLNDLNIS